MLQFGISEIQCLCYDIRGFYGFFWLQVINIIILYSSNWKSLALYYKLSLITMHKSEREMADLKRQIRQLTGQMSASSPIEESSNISAEYGARGGIELSQGTECTICFDAPKSIVLFPCKHLCLCSNCSATKSVDECPMCAAEIQYKLDIFP